MTDMKMPRFWEGIAGVQHRLSERIDYPFINRAMNKGITPSFRAKDLAQRLLPTRPLFSRTNTAQPCAGPWGCLGPTAPAQPRLYLQPQSKGGLWPARERPRKGC